MPSTICPRDGIKTGRSRILLVAIPSTSCPRPKTSLEDGLKRATRYASLTCLDSPPEMAPDQAVNRRGKRDIYGNYPDVAHRATETSGSPVRGFQLSVFTWSTLPVVLLSTSILLLDALCIAMMRSSADRDGMSGPCPPAPESSKKRSRGFPAGGGGGRRKTGYRVSAYPGPSGVSRTVARLSPLPSRADADPPHSVH